MRAMLSVALPAACGTTRRIGRSGNSARTACANAAQAIPAISRFFRG
jgi:hypothetical protein